MNNQENVKNVSDVQQETTAEQEQQQEIQVYEANGRSTWGVRGSWSITVDEHDNWSYGNCL